MESIWPSRPWAPGPGWSGHSGPPCMHRPVWTQRRQSPASTTVLVAAQARAASLVTPHSGNLHQQ